MVTAINGGLGNQMFQYAAGRRLAHINGKELLLYLGERYRPGSYRTYRLDRFHVAGRIATAGEAGGLKKASRTRQRLGKFLPALAAPDDPDLVQEESLRFNPMILTLQNNAKLNGYWQCEGYFSDIAGIVRKDFILRDGLTGRDRDVLDRIRSGPSAFIHVRRGDYVTYPVFSEKFAACSLDYYREAAALLRERVGLGLRFFVFSNDPSWVRGMKIGGEDAEIIDWNADTPERDLALMRECSHAVIANSSFSWWGAWLGDSRERIVIAPLTWFRHQPDSHDIVPERWLKLG